ncbi:MAG: hypothetical protein GF317_17160 [Candidatus Lokiarchaeota archaeon]|nr:hypothetical protein [Candidatus Lokiarchaeota archaeon]MBD3201242.1 hypothetical protein [Candidatus Lokiarchaeota archaeon]
MVRYYLYVLKILNALLFLWIIFIFLSLFDFSAVLMTSDSEIVLFDVIIVFKNLLSFGFFFIFYFIGYGIAFIVSFLFSPLPFFNNGFMFTFLDLFFKNFLSLWFTFPSGTTPELFQVPQLMLNELLVFAEDFYLLIFQILFILAIIYMIRGIIQNDPKHNMYALGCLVLMIILPLIIFGLREMLELFNLVEPFNSLGIIDLNNLADPLSPLFNDLPIDDFFAFFASPVTLFAVIGYIYLEMAFQVNYTNTVTRPSLERSDRLEAQLNLLRKESVNITANIDKIREEAKQMREELGLEKEVVSKFISQKDKRFSYVSEMIERKKLESEEKQLVSAASKTRRLGRYINQLFREDSEAEDTLTARSAAPKARNLALSTIFNSAFRLIVLITISFIIIHPEWFFENVFLLPPAITESVAVFSPEIIIILLLPIILLFPVIAHIISYVKHRSLMIQLKQEGQIREILASVGDYVKKDEIEDSQETDQTETAEQVTTPSA